MLNDLISVKNHWSAAGDMKTMLNVAVEVML